MDDTCNPYDAVPYQSGTFPQTHPQHLATLGTLFEMTPADVESCRVLELGCAEGGNLIPLAAELPASQFVGLDYSANQIAVGNARIEETGLSNIELRHADIRVPDSSLGRFDFIIAHGVYSWVTKDVRRRILEICRDHLTDCGIAFVSFIAKPGGHLRRMIREMLLYHTRRITDPGDKATESRRFLDFLIAAAPENATAYRAVLEWERRHVRQSRDHQLLHDLLEIDLEPVGIVDFMEESEPHGLQYLGDADFPSMLARNLGPKVMDQLRATCRTLVEVEQYMDFVRNRAFRQTLLCHGSVRLVHQVDPRIIERLFIAAKLTSGECRSPATGDPWVFRAADGSEVTTTAPIAKAAFAVLQEHWPGNLPFAELRSQAQSRLSSFGRQALESDAAELCGTLFTCFSNRLIELCVRRYSCAGRVAPFPAASWAARVQARQGEIVANLRHETVRLQPLQRAVLRELDGSQPVDAISDRVTAELSQETLRLDAAHDGPAPLQFHRHEIAEKVTASLKELAELGLLLR